MRVYGTHISINLATRRLSFFEGNRQVHTYPVGVGKASTPTPLGNYTVIVKIMHPGGALGTRWMGLSIPGGNYGIHGTNNPPSIGGYVSNGCIRMYNQDVEQLFPKVEIGTPVEIHSGRNNPKPEQVPFDPRGGGRTHLVQPGESLWGIAGRYGKDLNAIIQSNKLSSPELIYPGQVILIPD